MKAKIIYTALAMVLVFSLAAVVVPVSPEVSAHAGSPINSNWASVTPTVDGTLSAGEWDDAATVTFGGATVKVKNDGTNLYMAAEVPDTTQTGPPFPTLIGDFFSIAIDDGDNGLLVEGDEDAMSLAYLSTVLGWPADYVDGYWDTSSPDASTHVTLSADSVVHGLGAFTWDGANYYYEFSKPLNSLDPQDMAASPGLTIGVAMCHADMGTFTMAYWPAGLNPTNATTWGNIVLATGEHSVASSTMIFEETAVYQLTDNGDGTYTGVLPMVDENAQSLGDKQSGFDIYADNGATAWFGDDPGTGEVWTSLTVAGHDAWPTWTPDTPDWYQYSLTFFVLDYYGTPVPGWYIANHAGATYETPWYQGGNLARGVPMAGSMNWTAMYAGEWLVGAYLPGTGVPEIPGGAALHGGGPQAWDMDWSWGSEAVPLEYQGFTVTITDSDQDTLMEVVLTPAAVPEEPTPTPTPPPAGEGCFIATAAYGTESAQEIDVLRAFRDEVLLESTVGSQLVDWYYQTSPPVADFISENSLLRTLVRELVIDPMVSVATFTQAIWGK